MVSRHSDQGRALEVMVHEQPQRGEQGEQDATEAMASAEYYSASHAEQQHEHDQHDADM